MVRVLTNGPGYQNSISGRFIPKTQKRYWIPPCLTLSIIRKRSRVSGIFQGNVLYTPLHLTSVAF